MAAAASAEEGQIYACHSVSQWEEQFKKAVETKKLVVINFTASWCGPCRVIAPFLAEIAKKTPHVIFFKVDVDELKTVADEFNVNSMPTFVFLKEGKKIHVITGASKDELVATIEKHGTHSASAY